MMPRGSLRPHFKGNFVIIELRNVFGLVFWCEFDECCSIVDTLMSSILLDPCIALLWNLYELVLAIRYTITDNLGGITV